MSERAHALLSASDAHRWLNCPPSARLTQDMPDEPSPYAEDGQLAHQLAEWKLRMLFGGEYTEADETLPLPYTLDPQGGNPEMNEHTNTYVEIVKSAYDEAVQNPLRPIIKVEQRVDYSPWVPKGFGTADCVIISDGTAHVFDFKYGKGVPVSAVSNPQLMLYALGVYNAYGRVYDLKLFSMTVVQPRINNTSTWAMTRDELLEWGKLIRPVASMAYAGEGMYEVGDWCRWCRARRTCKERAVQLVTADFSPFRASDTGMGGPVDPRSLTVEEIGRYLGQAKLVRNWLTDLEDYALHSALSGADIPGWKAVRGTAKRAWTDHEAAFAAAARVKPSNTEPFYEWTPISVAAMERAIGKKLFASHLSAYVHTPPGKPTLVPVTDKRESIPVNTVETDFGNERENEIDG